MPLPSQIHGLLLAAAVQAGIPQTAIAQAPDSSPYRLVATISLPDPVRWDYMTVDTTHHRLYVSHGDSVAVIDTESDKVIGKVGPTPGGSHGIAIVPETTLGYTDDGKAGAALSFDTSTFAAKTTIPTGPDADGIFYDSSSRHVFVINGDSGRVTVIDPAVDRAIAQIETGEALEFGVAGTDGFAFIDGVKQADIVKIDTRTNTVAARIAVTGCTAPHGAAIDSIHGILFVTCTNKLMFVVDAKDGRILKMIPIGAGSDAAAFDARRLRAFSSNGDGTLSIVQENGDGFESLPSVATAPGARTMAVDEGSGRVYLVTAERDPAQGTIAPGTRPRLLSGTLKVLVLEPRNP